MTNEMTATETRHRAAIALQVVLLVFTPVALLSIGGLAIYCAPALVPLLWIGGAAAPRAGRWVYAFLAALVMGEVSWAFANTLAPGLQAVLPALALVLMPVFFIKTFKTATMMRSVGLVLVVCCLLGSSGLVALRSEDSQSYRETKVGRVER